jgi:hypothetical protein
MFGDAGKCVLALLAHGVCGCWYWSYVVFKEMAWKKKQKELKARAEAAANGGGEKASASDTSHAAAPAAVSSPAPAAPAPAPAVPPRGSPPMAAPAQRRSVAPKPSPARVPALAAAAAPSPARTQPAPAKPSGLHAGHNSGPGLDPGKSLFLLLVVFAECTVAFTHSLAVSHSFGTAQARA